MEDVFVMDIKTLHSIAALRGVNKKTIDSDVQALYSTLDLSQRVEYMDRLARECESWLKVYESGKRHTNQDKYRFRAVSLKEVNNGR